MSTTMVRPRGSLQLAVTGADSEDEAAPEIISQATPQRTGVGRAAKARLSKEARLEIRAAEDGKPVLAILVAQRHGCWAQEVTGPALMRASLHHHRRRPLQWQYGSPRTFCRDVLEVMR